MKRLIKVYQLVIFFLLLSIGLQAQHRHVDELKRTDRFGFTTMFRYTYKNWITGNNKTKGNMYFDSFRIWAQTDVDKKFFGAFQYRFYEGWRTPLYLYMGYNIDENNKLQLGQTWVPFGIDYQPFDDWGNLAYYVGLQDDYDYGVTWNGNFDVFDIYVGFFKNQQLSSSSTHRYDSDIYSGNKNTGDLILVPKQNQEVNQLNLRLAFKPSGNNWDAEIGISGMAGQIYNETTDENGSRYAGAIHAILNMGIFHYTVQGTWYNYSQVLPDTVPSSYHDFINVSSWNFAYEIPTKANVFTTSASVDIIGEKLSIYTNYSYLWGGTSETSSQLITGGISTLWDSFEVYAETYYGVNDPQFSGKASGYGRNAHSYDLRVDVRFFYKLNIVSEETIERVKQKLNKNE